MQNVINLTNQIYRLKGWAVVDEVPTPTKNIRGHIAYEKKSTVDYYGITHGRALAFDAKSTRNKTRFDLKNVHAHQVDYLQRFKDQGGLAFFIIEFATLNQSYFVPFDFLHKYWLAAENGRPKSIPIADIDLNCERIRSERGVALDYLKYCS